MKILFIAPLPPPISGQTVAVNFLYDYLAPIYEVKVINTNKKSFSSGLTSFSRIIEVLSFFFLIFKNKSNYEKFYITSSESIAGNIKDLFIYFILINRLKDITIHIHGGSFVSQILKRNKFLFVINKFFLRRFNSVIVLSKSHHNNIKECLGLSNIEIVPNFVEKKLFISDEDLIKKFQNTEKVNIIFFSNLIKGKGFDLLLKAYLNLDVEIQRFSTLQFAGSFESKVEEESFLRLIDNYENIQYLGLLEGEAKKQFLNNAIVFCLPTSFNEGQPISILEAYASGCVVLATPKEGIMDILKVNENGFFISETDTKILEDKLKEIVLEKDKYRPIGENNLLYAKNNFQLIEYQQSLENILTKIKY